MLKPRPPFACLRSVTVLCFRRREFLIGKKILDIGHWDGIVRVTGREFRWASGALWRTYIYLGVGAACANHIQLLYGQSVSGQFQADVVGIVGLFIVQQGNSGFCLFGGEGEAGLEKSFCVFRRVGQLYTQWTFWSLPSCQCCLLCCRWSTTPGRALPRPCWRCLNFRPPEKKLMII